MNIVDEIRSLPKDERLDAALDLIRSIFDPDTERLASYCRAFRISRSEAFLVDMMARRPGTVFDLQNLGAAIDLWQGTDRSSYAVKRAVQRAKSALPAGTIQNLYGIGYFIPADKADAIAAARAACVPVRAKGGIPAAYGSNDWPVMDNLAPGRREGN